MTRHLVQVCKRIHDSTVPYSIILIYKRIQKRQRVSGIIHEVVGLSNILKVGSGRIVTHGNDTARGNFFWL